MQRHKFLPAGMPPQANEDSADEGIHRLNPFSRLSMKLSNASLNPRHILDVRHTIQIPREISFKIQEGSRLLQTA